MSDAALTIGAYPVLKHLALCGYRREDQTDDYNPYFKIIYILFMQVHSLKEIYMYYY